MTSPQGNAHVCAFYLKGRCRFGEQCKFLHKDPEQSIATDSQPGNSAVATQSNCEAEGRTERDEVRHAETSGHGTADSFSHELRASLPGTVTNDTPKVNSADRKGSRKGARRRKSEAQRREETRNKQREAKTTEREARKAMQELRQAEDAKKEAAFTIQRIVCGSTLVTCSAGMDIHHVLSGFETCRLTIKNLPLDAKPEEVTALFTQQGLDPLEILILYIKNCGQMHREAQVLARSEQGVALAAGLDGVEFRDEHLKFEITGNTTVNAMGERTSRNSDMLTISWHYPSVTMIVNYSSMDEARKKAETLDKKIIKGRRVKVEMNRPPPPGPATRHFIPSSIRIIGLPLDVTTEEVYQFAGSFPIRKLKSHLYSLPAAIDSLRLHLNEISDGRMKSFRVASQDELEGNISVEARFDSWDVAKIAYDSLDGKRLRDDMPLFRLSLPRPLQYTSSIPAQQYTAQKDLWDALATPRSDKSIFLRIFNKDNGRVNVVVGGDDKKAVGSLKVRVESLVAGERLDPAFWHRSFDTTVGTRFLTTVYSETGAYVRVDWKIRALKLHGVGAAKEKARQMITDEVHRLSLLEWTVNLKRESVSFFIRKGLAALKEILGEDSAHLDLTSRPYKLTLKGGEEARHTLTRLIDESLDDPAIGQEAEAEMNDICPICYDRATHPVKLSCDHVYCMACFRHYLASATDTKNFPLLCIGDEDKCRVSIPIPAIQRFLPQHQFDNLLDAAFTTFLDQHPQDYRYCPTPDCTQIYRCNGVTHITCPSCFVAVCSVCHQEAHEGMTCAERGLHKDIVEQERLNEVWASGHGVKRCPTCQVWIEKTEGCNHMTCKCGAHICWKCMGIFDGETIYTHMNTAHGGIFDAPPVAHDDLEHEDREDVMQRQIEFMQGVARERQEQQERQRQVEVERHRRAEYQRMMDERQEQRLARERQEQQERQRQERQERIQRDARGRQEGRRLCVVM